MNSDFEYQFEHHRLAAEKLVHLFKDQPDVIGIILGGSVAKGLARPDSDVDAMVIVRDSYYESLRRQNRIFEVIHADCPYEGGFYDLKYFSLDYLKTAARQGNEPTRNSFLQCQILYQKSDLIQDYLKEITAYPVHEKQDRILSFYAAFSLYCDYFWNDALRSDEVYLKTFAAADIVLFGLRMILAENETFFPSHKRLVETVCRLGEREAKIAEKGTRFLQSFADAHKKDFEQAIRDYNDWPVTQDHDKVVTRFADDHEQWWYRPRPNVYEW